MTKSHKIRGDKGQAGTKPLVGGVLHDDRGNAVWHWVTDTARHAALSTSSVLKRLNVSNLSLEETLDQERRQSAAWASYTAAAASGRTAAGKAAARKGAPGKAAAPGTGAASGKAAATGKSTGAVQHKPRARSWWRRLFQRR